MSDGLKEDMSKQSHTPELAAEIVSMARVSDVVQDCKKEFKSLVVEVSHDSRVRGSFDEEKLEPGNDKDYSAYLEQLITLMNEGWRVLKQYEKNTAYVWKYGGKHFVKKEYTILWRYKPE